MPRRKLSDVERLSRSIANAIRRSVCPPVDVVDALLSVAAGRAAVSETHDCNQFQTQAHEAFHAALTVLSERGARIVN